MTRNTTTTQSSFSLVSLSWVLRLAIISLVVQMMTSPSRTTANSFTVSTTKTRTHYLQQSQQEQRHTTRGTSSSSTFLLASVEDDTEVSIDEAPSSEIDTTLQNIIDELYPNGELVTLVIKDHRPLGCTVEESLATPTTNSDETVDKKQEYVVKMNDDDDDDDDDDVLIGLDDAPAVFVSKVVADGHAEQAGMKVGDVVVGVTGLFGNVMAVSGFDIERVKDLVSAVPDEEPLTICIARGTSVLADHESALVDLCSVTPGASDKQIEDCVVAYLTMEESEDAAVAAEAMEKVNGGDMLATDDDEDLCDDDDLECMMDAMNTMWADELPPSKASTSGIMDRPETPVQKAKPWSSRSSPSGTYVRDPKTGQMRNIDAQK